MWQGDVAAEVRQLFAAFGAVWDDQLIEWQVRHRLASAKNPKTRPRQAGNVPRFSKCRAGHEWTPENTYQRPCGRRQCKTCHREQSLKSWRRRQSRTAPGEQNGA